MCHLCERRLPVFSSHDFMPKDQLDPEFQQEESAVEKGLVLFFLAFLARQKGLVLDGRHKQDSSRLRNKLDHEKQLLDFVVAFQLEGDR